MPFPYGETVILHRTRVIPNPDPFSSEDLTETEDVVLEGASVSISKGSETYTDGGTRQITTRSVRVREHVDIGPDDEMTVRGTRYQVDGETSGPQVNVFTGTFFGSRIDLRSVNG